MCVVSRITSLGHSARPSASPCCAAIQRNKFSCTKQRENTLSGFMWQQTSTACRLPALHRGTARPSEPARVYPHNTIAFSCCASSRCRGCAAGAHAHPAQGLPSVHSVPPPPLPAAPRVNHLSHKQTTHLSLEKSISSRVTCGTSGICLGWKDLSSLADFDSK